MHINFFSPLKCGNIQFGRCVYILNFVPVMFYTIHTLHSEHYPKSFKNENILKLYLLVSDEAVYTKFHIPTMF